MAESKKIIDQLEKEGWVEVSHKGSHVTFKKEGVAYLITVPQPRGHLGKGLRSKIEKAAGWR